MKWYSEKGSESDVVISTRIRLARNLVDYPFPGRLDPAGKARIASKVREALSGGECGEFGFIEMTTINGIQAIALAERHIISPEFTSRARGSALLLTEDESASIMVCEEDHIRLQVIRPGLALEQAYEAADRIDTLLDSRLHFAFDEKMGYLTQYPTNLGTAMRASVMLHLPALTRCGRISRLASTVSKLGLNISSVYGDGSKSLGDIYRLSNQITLGISEQAAISNLKSIAFQLIEQERAAAKDLMADPVQVDRVFRALGILRYARLLSGKEFMELISIVRMGVATGVIDLPHEKLNELILNMQSATITAANADAADSSGREAIRAAAVREILKGEA